MSGTQNTLNLVGKNIVSFPSGILLHIFSLLDLKSIYSVALVNLQWNELCKENWLWYKLRRAHWEIKKRKWQNFNWKRYYIEKFFLLKKENLILSQQITPPNTVFSPRSCHSVNEFGI